MSLVPNYIEGESGKWYQNPVIRHKDRAWYICFDDDDPPELVIRQSACAAADLAEYTKIIST